MAINYVQSSAVVTSGGPASITISGVTPGNQLIFNINVEAASQPSITSVADSKTNTWSKVYGTSSGGYFTQQNEIWFCNSAASGNTTITGTFTPVGTYGNGVSLTVFEFSGIGGVDGSATYNTASGTQNPNVTITPNQFGDLLLGYFPDANWGPSALPGVPWNSFTNGASQAFAWQVYPSTSPTNPTWTLVGNTLTWGVIGAAFYPAINPSGSLANYPGFMGDILLGASPLGTGGTIVHNIYVKLALIVSTSISTTNKFAHRIKTSNVIQTSLSNVSRALARVRQSAVVATNLVTSSKLFKRVKNSAVVQTSIANSVKTIKRIKTSVVDATNLINTVRIRSKNKAISVVQSALITSTRLRSKVRSITLVQSSLSIAKKTLARVRTTKVTSTQLVQIIRSIKRIRVTTVIQTNLAIAIKTIKRVKATTVIQIPLSIAKKTISRVKLSSANLANLVKSVKIFSRVKKSIAVGTNLIRSNKALNKSSKVIQTLLATSSKAAKHLRTVLANAINYVLPKRVDQIFRYSTVRAINLIISTKKFARVRIVKPIQVSTAIAVKTAKYLRKTTVTSTNLVKSLRGKAKSALVTATSLVTSSKLFKRIRISVVVQTPIVYSVKLLKRIRKALATGTDAALNLSLIHI